MADLTANTISLSNPGTSFQYAVEVAQPSGGPAGVLEGKFTSGAVGVVLALGGAVVSGENSAGKYQVGDPSQGTAAPVAELSDRLYFGPGTGAFDVSLYRYAGTLKTDGQLRALDGVKTIEIASAGKTKAADGDFAHVPTDGTVAVVRNTSNGNVYLSARSNGGWKSVQLS